MEKQLEAPVSRDELDYIDTIVLDGRIDWVTQKVGWDEEERYVGIRSVSVIPLFRGQVMETVTGEFAFSPEMEKRLGWGDIVADMSYAISDVPVDPSAVAEDAILGYYGLVERKFDVYSSDTSGYLWTDEEFRIGGHSVIDILKGNIGRYVHLEIRTYRPKKR